jgi:hypothetical protein
VTQRLHDTPWRQGHVLSDETARALDLFHPEHPSETVVVVVSHDCDLASESEIEPFCEIIVGRRVSNQDGNATRSKNPRKLHLNFSGACPACVIEMEAQKKRLLPKIDLVSHTPSNSIVPNIDEKTTLQAWLSARYARASFPNEFDRRLKEDAKKSYNKIVRIFEKNEAHLRSVYFDVDELERDGPEDVYPLTIFLVYDIENDAIKSKIAADKAAAEITTIFEQEFKKDGSWSNIELVRCFPVSENAMSMRAIRYAKRWHLDHLSLSK